MPKKTRKEKIIASQRRTEQEISPTFTVGYRPIVKFDQQTETQKTPVITKSDPKQFAYELATHKYFVHDFRKSVFFICIIFAVEIFLYFARIGNYLVR